jgi:hypothetical protein
MLDAILQHTLGVSCSSQCSYHTAVLEHWCGRSTWDHSAAAAARSFIEAELPAFEVSG